VSGRFHCFDRLGIRNERVKRKRTLHSHSRVIKRTASETDSPMASNTLAALAFVSRSIRVRRVVSLAIIRLRGQCSASCALARRPGWP
jgi:hypothetical protein